MHNRKALPIILLKVCIENQEGNNLKFAGIELYKLYKFTVKNLTIGMHWK